MTDPIDGPLKTLIIGAGRRVKNNFLPALSTMRKDFNIVGIHATSRVRAQPLSDQWGIPVVDDLGDYDLRAVDVVAISVPTGANKIALQKLAPFSDRLKIVIDTPISSSRAEMKEIWPLLSDFTSAFAAEDYMNFPPFALARAALAAGLIGNIRQIELENIGYLYHGLALIRSFVGFAKVIASWRLREDNIETIFYKIEGGLKASVIGPYLRAGRLVIRGTKGELIYSDSDIDDCRPSGDGKFYIRSSRDHHGAISGFTVVDGTGILPGLSLAVPTFRAMTEMEFDDKSDLNLLRGCGLAAVFSAIKRPDGLNDQYGVENALYDGVISRAATKGRMPYDPFRLIGTDIVRVVRAL